MLPASLNVIATVLVANTLERKCTSERSEIFFQALDDCEQRPAVQTGA